MKKGFSFVEVLIAIAVLAIVAASTIYIIKNVIPEEYTYTAKKVSVTLSDGVKTLLSDERLYPHKKFTDGEKFCKDYSALFANRGNSDCTKNKDISSINFSTGDKLSFDFYDNTNLQTASGEMWIGLNQRFKDENTPIKIIVDVNGPKKGHNILGEDVVLLSLYSNGKIGEYERFETSTNQKTPDAQDCNKCEYTEKAVPNSCSAASKGKKYWECKNYPQCNKQSGPYACCGYILNNYWDYNWSSWISRQRTTKDDLGNICTQKCDYLRKKENDEFISCTAERLGQDCDTYWIKTFFLDFLGSKVNECTKCKGAYECCAYMKNHLSSYLTRWGTNGWTSEGKTISVGPIDRQGTKEDCTLSCENLEHKEDKTECSSSKKYRKIDKYYLAGTEIAACKKDTGEKACCVYMKNNLSIYWNKWGYSGWDKTNGKTIKDEQNADCTLKCSNNAFTTKKEYKSIKGNGCNGKILSSKNADSDCPWKYEYTKYLYNKKEIEGCRDTKKNPSPKYKKTFTLKNPIVIGDDAGIRPDLGSASNYVKNCSNLRSNTSTANKNSCTGSKEVLFSDINGFPKNGKVTNCDVLTINDKNCTGTGTHGSIYCLSVSTASCTINNKSITINIKSGAYIDGKNPSNKNKITAFDDWAVAKVKLTVEVDEED